MSKIQFAQMKFFSKVFVIVTAYFFCHGSSIAQVGTSESNFMSLSSNATSATKMANTDVNLFTGLPSISLPLYSFNHHSGIGMSITADYFAGGIKVGESPSSLGLGWNLSVGGVVTRTVRGMPDEHATNGFLFASTLPADYRPDGNKYYYDSLDAEQDLFQYSINGRSGKFLIGKNNEIVLIPLSKIRISYSSNPSVSTAIGSFTIITEDGVKYVFSDVDKSSVGASTMFASGYANYVHPQAWYLSKVIAPFATDSIRFNYSNISGTNSFKYPETIHVNSSGTITSTFNGTGSGYMSSQKKISSIDLPGKKHIDFIYDPILKFDQFDSILNKIHFSDSVFRYGFVFERHGVYYDTIMVGLKKVLSPPLDKRSFLSGIKYYTKVATTPGYTFAYNGPFFQKIGSAYDTIANKRDHWGFYKSSVNNTGTAIPTVPGIYTGANRTASDIYDVTASSLSSITNPNGGITVYTYESNKIYPFDLSAQTFSVEAINATQNSITVNQVVSNQFDFRLSFTNAISRLSSIPFSGTANMTCIITSTDGATTYFTKTVSLHELFYVGNISIKTSLLNGNYLFKTTTSSGTSASTLPINVTWNNEVSSSGTGNVVGGARIKSISQRRPHWNAVESQVVYKYETADGKSSGFMGMPPTYHYPITKVKTTNGGSPVTTYETAISSEPNNNLNYTQGNLACYSRVEVTQFGASTASNENGTTIYEFTDLKDAGAAVSASHFPFVPQTQKEWLIGLPKKILVYDKLGRLIQTTTNTYNHTSVNYENVNFKSLRLGMTHYNSNYNTSNNILSPTTKSYAGQLYYPESGRSDLITTIDTFYHSTNSFQVTKKEMEFDTNYNPVKLTTTYDKTRGLMLEKRMYYPYSYNLGGAIGTLKTNKIFSPVSSEQWITGDGNSRIIAAEIMDFQTLSSGQIKPLNAYSLQSNAPVSASSIGAFNPSSLVRNTSLILPQKNFAAYDLAGNIAEIKNPATNQSNVVLMDYDNQLPVANISNASLPDVAYTSFESDSKGNWTINNFLKDNTYAITGKKCYNLSSGAISKSELTPATTYIISYWTRNSSALTISGSSTPVLAAQQNGWNLYTQTITGVTSVTISGSGYLDELRLYPKDANMITTTHEPMVGPLTICDANNTIIYNEYDGLNRLIVVRDKDKNIVKKYEFSNTTYISLNPNWQSNGEERCQTPLNGNKERGETDINIYSSTFGTKRFVFDHANNSSCQPACNLEGQKMINNVCENGTKVYTSSRYVKVCETSQCEWKWLCTYHYVWSDSSTSSNYEVYSPYACDNEY